MATLNDLKNNLQRLEGSARKQVSALMKAAERSLKNPPIGPGPRRQLLKAVKKLRTELNRNLMKLERSLTPRTPRKSAKR